MRNELTIHDLCVENFLSLIAAFKADFHPRPARGAVPAVILEGKLVELWTGFAGASQQKPRQDDATQQAGFTTRIFKALCARMLTNRDFWIMACQWPVTPK